MGEVYAGRYELIDLLGEGAAGAVWRVWDRRQRRYVAAKLLRQRDAEGLLRFVREQSLRVVNPHVVPPIGWAAEDHDVLLTMDLVNGGTITQLLEDYTTLPAPFVAALMDQLLDALAAVHESGLVHRDVKPGNLLLEPTGDGPPFLRLGDFGVATVLGTPRLTNVGMVLGTPGYMAPEIWLGADPDPRQDLFAAGVVARQMLTGQRPPSNGPLPADPSPPTVPETLWSWVGRLTDHRPEQRCATAVDARHALRSAMPAGGPQAGHTDQRRIVVPDRVGPLPSGWTPAEATSQPTVRDAEPPTQISARLPVSQAWSQPAPSQPAPAQPAPPWAVTQGQIAPPTRVVTMAQQPPAQQPPAQHPYQPAHIPPAPPDPGAPQARATHRLGPRPLLRLLVALVLVAVAMIAFLLAAKQGGA